MKHLSKFGAKIFLGVACALLVISLAFSAYSFAGYVSRVESSGGASPAPIMCSVTVNGGKETFINAPYIQTVGGNSRPIRMNDWTESVIKFKNNGNVGLNYTYSFVFYMPKDFAESAMFQLLELTPEAASVTGQTESDVSGDENDSVFRASDVVKASKPMRLSDTAVGGTRKIVISDKTADNIEIENEYESFITQNKELKIDMGEGGSSKAELRTASESATVHRTYASYYDNGVNGPTEFACPVSFAETAELNFYRVLINLTDTSDRVLREDGVSHRYVLRMVPRKALPNDNHVWNVEDYFPKKTVTSDDGTTTTEVTDYGDLSKAVQPVSGNQDYKFAWAASGDGAKLTVVRKDGVNADGSVKWTEPRDVNIANGVGITNPCKVAAVFTQTDR